MSECHKNVDDYYGCHITVWIPRCAGREAFDGVEPLPEFFPTKSSPRIAANLWQLEVFFSAAPTAQNSPELHFRFINSFIQPYPVGSLVPFILTLNNESHFVK